MQVREYRFTQIAKKDHIPNLTKSALIANLT